MKINIKYKLFINYDLQTKLNLVLIYIYEETLICLINIDC